MALTEILAFSVLYLLQRASHKEALATKVKFDEVIRALSEARNSIIQADTMSERELRDVAADIQEQIEEVEEAEERTTWTGHVMRVPPDRRVCWGAASMQRQTRLITSALLWQVEVPWPEWTASAGSRIG